MGRGGDRGSAEPRGSGARATGSGVPSGLNGSARFGPLVVGSLRDPASGCSLHPAGRSARREGEEGAEAGAKAVATSEVVAHGAAVREGRDVVGGRGEATRAELRHKPHGGVLAVAIEPALEREEGLGGCQRPAEAGEGGGELAEVGVGALGGREPVVPLAPHGGDRAERGEGDQDQSGEGGGGCPDRETAP